MEPRDQRVRTFFEQPDRYLGRRFGLRIRAEIVRELLGETPGARILDVGCGDGSISMPLLEESSSLALLDVSERMLDIARGRMAPGLAGKVSYHNTDFLSFDPETQFEVILCIGVLAHVSSIEQAVQKISKLLASGGRCVLQFSDQDRAIARLEVHYSRLRRRLRDNYGYSLNLMTSDQVLGLTSRMSLNLKDSRRYSLLLPGMGKLPNGVLYRYQRLTLRSALLSRFGSEVIALLEKAE